MAKFQKKKIQETEGGEFGNYKEDTGGGKPFSTSNTRTTKDNGKYRQANNDTMQPRTSDGKFTYKSANGESIDPKYGPSRGKTVNPILTGGKNGIKIEDVESQFAAQSGAYWNKYKDKWYTKGGEYMLISQGKGHKKDWATRIAGQNIWDLGKARYDKVKGEFTGESKIFEEGKKGRLGKEEVIAKQQAQTTGEEQAVISGKTGGVKLKPGYTFTPAPVKQKPTQPSGTIGQQPVSPSGSQQPTQPQPTVNQAPQSKYSDEQLKQAKEVFDENGIDYSGLTVGELDSLIDDSIDFGEEENSTTESNSSAPETNENKTEEKEEDSETIKKIKNMGFEE